MLQGGVPVEPEICPRGEHCLQCKMKNEAEGVSQSQHAKNTYWNVAREEGEGSNESSTVGNHNRGSRCVFFLLNRGIRTAARLHSAFGQSLDKCVQPSNG